MHHTIVMDDTFVDRDLHTYLLQPRPSTNALSQRFYSVHMCQSNELRSTHEDIVREVRATEISEVRMVTSYTNANIMVIAWSRCLHTELLTGDRFAHNIGVR